MIDRQLYEARLMLFHDEEANLEAAWQQAWLEGYEEGYEEAYIIGRIQILQQQLGEAESDTDQLAAVGPEVLKEMLADLQQRYRADLT